MPPTAQPYTANPIPSQPSYAVPPKQPQPTYTVQPQPTYTAQPSYNAQPTYTAQPQPPQFQGSYNSHPPAQKPEYQYPYMPQGPQAQQPQGPQATNMQNYGYQQQHNFPPPPMQ